MSGPANPVAIFLPVLLVVALTIAGFLRLSVVRTRSLKAQPRDPGFFRAYQGPPEPEAVVVAVRHYGNLFEAPVLFYAGCLSLFVLAAVGRWSLVWAWGYAIARLVQSLVHLGPNNPMHRGLAFVLGWLFLVLLWCDVTLAVLTRL